jgi:hypothetical protein
MKALTTILLTLLMSMGAWGGEEKYTSLEDFYDEKEELSNSDFLYLATRCLKVNVYSQNTQKFFNLEKMEEEIADKFIKLALGSYLLIKEDNGEEYINKEFASELEDISKKHHRNYMNSSFKLIKEDLEFCNYFF